MVVEFTALDWLDGCFGKQSKREIIAKFKGYEETALYTDDVLELLSTDPEIEWIIDAETGELLFNNY